MEKENKEPLRIQMRKNPWIVWTIALGILFILMCVSSIYKTKTEIKSENEMLCSVISGTPAWASDGKIIDYGEKIPKDYSTDLVRLVLIPNRIKFLYNPGCSHCEAQISYFKEQGTWEEYVNKDLTIDCSKY